MAIEKRGDGYRVRWWTLDGRQRSRKCASRKLAQQLEADIREAHSLGREWEPAPVRTADPALQDVARAWIDARRLRCRPHTVRMDGTHLELFMRFVGERADGDDTVAVLSRALLDEFLAWLRKPETGMHGRQRGMDAATKSVRAVQLMWLWAEESERWPGIPRPRTIELPRAQPGPVLAPTWAEMDACVAECSGWQKQLALWLRYTGLRSGESMAVLWSDVDMDRGTLTIRPEIDKTGRGRVVPMHPALLDLVATWGKREGYVVPCGRRKGVREREVRGRDIAAAWLRAGVREAVWRKRPDHAFRRGFKTGLLALGANADAVDFLQGHQLGAGSRGRYIDPWQALPLRETITLVPVVGASTGNVVRLKAGK